MRALSWSQLPARTRFTTILALGVCGAGVAGALHFAELLVADWGLGEFRWFSREFLWESPLAYGAFLVPGTLLLATIAWRFRHPTHFVFAGGAVAATALFGVLLPYAEIARIASLILAIGAGVATGRVLSRSPERWARALRRAATAIAAAVPLIALAQGMYRRTAEARAISATPAPATGAPNVLLIVLDAGRAKSVGFVTPAAHTTPKLDHWAASSTVFENAYAVAPWTLPSHASMMTGRWPRELSADWTVPIDRVHPMLAEEFHRQGYTTAAFMANLHYTAYDSGLSRGFLHYDDYRIDPEQILVSSSYAQTALVDSLRRIFPRMPLDLFLHPNLSIVPHHRYRVKLAGEVVDAFLDWQQTIGARPFFTLLNLMDPHLKTSAPLDVRRRYPHDTRGEPDYLEAMRYLDGQLDRMLRLMDERGALGKTVVIITGDHGELLGEHGLMGHAQSIYRDVVHVPLLIRYPASVPAGRRIDRVVSLRDLAATISDLAHLGGNIFPGTSLAVTWRDTTVTTSPAWVYVRRQPNATGTYPTASGALSGLYERDWYYLKNYGTGQEELFNPGTDAAETTDFARMPGADSLLRPWRERLARLAAK